MAEHCAGEATGTGASRGGTYPPGTPAHGSDTLTAHIEQCEKHPARQLARERDRERARADKTEAVLAAAREKVKGLQRSDIYLDERGRGCIDERSGGRWVPVSAVLAALSEAGD